jgi:hypothetical protein
MNNSKYIPQLFNCTKNLCKEQSEIKLSKFIERYNEGKVYGQRIISSQINTIKTLISELADKLRHRQTIGRRFHITVGNLAKMCKCSIKTAYNHITRLLDAGILSKARTTHKFRETDSYQTPCLKLELSLEILIFQVINSPVEVEKAVNTSQLAIPEISNEGIKIMKQLKIWPYDN